MNKRKRKGTRQSGKQKLATLRVDLRAVIAELKSLGCEDSTILVEFWHALDYVNGNAPRLP